ncbi:hypothetical protein LBMAG42_31150 [Deltaproteobacteria bacterium]|nr:hypothetical protein LBMAG42_31150 [Deltaproteobacteria bacterium]
MAHRALPSRYGDALALLLMLGCSDYSLTGTKQYSGLGDSGAEFEADTGGWTEYADADDTAGVSLSEATEASANASINVIFQYVSFGAETSACSFDVAFYEPAEDDGYGSGGTAQTITMPEVAGTCAFTRFDPDDTGSGGSMTVLGTLDAGEELHATNADYDIALAREEAADGSIRYRWSGCTHDTFPFGQTLSLSGAGAGAGVAIEAFSLTDAIAVGPDMLQSSPAAADLVLGILPQSVTTPLDWEWSWSADFPSTSEGPVAMSEMFVLRNVRREGDRLLESLACMPSADGALTVGAADLSQLTPDPGDDSTYASAQLDARFSGAEAEAPWGQTLRAQSLVSVSGLLRLSP